MTETGIAEIVVILGRFIAQRVDCAPDSIHAETALEEILRNEADWLALQRDIYRDFNCFITGQELHGLRTVGDLALLVKARTEATPSSPRFAAPETQEHLRDEASPQEGFQTVRVFYATDREKGALRGAIQDYQPRRGSGTLALGVSEVAIPATHEFGEMEGPPWWQFFRSPDPRRDITVLLAAELPYEVFWGNVRKCVASSSARDILVFIHGYNVPFGQGLRRAAQITHDLSFAGAPVLYSWPSQGSVGKYSADEASVEWTIPHFRDFLRQLLEGAGADQIHVIAHSLGNRAAIAAIRELRLDTLAPGAAELSQFVLAAPDIDADTFRQLAADFAKKPRRCTLYANTEDRALAASDWKHGGYARAGGGGEDLVVVPNVDTIDATGHATDFLSHSYFAGSDPVISDLFYVIRSSTPPDQRARLERREIGPLVYWRIAQ
jgi:esterase/lipase superfamily enzyme